MVTLQNQPNYLILKNGIEALYSNSILFCKLSASSLCILNLLLALYYLAYRAFGDRALPVSVDYMRPGLLVRSAGLILKITRLSPFFAGLLLRAVDLFYRGHL